MYTSRRFDLFCIKKMELDMLLTILIVFIVTFLLFVYAFCTEAE